MRVGILGSGLMGGKLGTLLARAGHDVVFSYARSRKKLEVLAREAGGNARAGTPGEAAREAEVLLLAVHWLRVDEVAAAPACPSIGISPIDQPFLYSSWRRHHIPVSLRPLGARSSHWYMPQRPSSPRAKAE